MLIDISSSYLPVSAGPLRILDIGTTPFTLFIKRQFPQYEICTIDLTDLLKERCRTAEIELQSYDLNLGACHSQMKLLT
jgi:hypothetical protein